MRIEVEGIALASVAAARDAFFSRKAYETWLAIALLSLLAVRLLSLALADTSLTVDEAQYWSWSRELAFGYFSKPPLIAWLIRGETALCGDAEACIRAASPLLYSIAAIFVFLAGRALYDARVGFWSAITFATLPGVSFSAGLITTDVPLLLFWTVALYAWIMLVETKKAGWALALGLAIGLGVLSKYAMVYFVICMGLHVALSEKARAAIAGLRWLMPALIAAALVAPNVWWNVEAGLPTFKHTLANGRPQEAGIHPWQALKFLAIQLAVFGPILLPVLVWSGWTTMRQRPRDDRKLALVLFSVPLLALMIAFALFTRGRPNWALVAYPAGAILATAMLLDLAWRRLLGLSLAIQLCAAALLAAGPTIATRLGKVGDPYARQLGWRSAAKVIREEASRSGAVAILSDDRAMTAELAYYLRDTGLTVYQWPRKKMTPNRFVETALFSSKAPEPVLYDTRYGRADRVTRKFRSATDLGTEHVAAGRGGDRPFKLYLLAGYSDGKG
jgi:4-amino-4-deoxy-L-arabinose transferase-like glycosyltransferase